MMGPLEELQKLVTLSNPLSPKLIIWELAFYIKECIYLCLSFIVTIPWRLNDYFVFVINDFPK